MVQKGMKITPVATFDLTHEQDTHLKRAVVAFEQAAIDKYTKGVKEHGGNLWDNVDLKLIDEAMKECIDQWFYLFTLKEKLLANIKS